jgi:mono/diheme cytochrome c family protein
VRSPLLLAAPVAAAAVALAAGCGATGVVPSGGDVGTGKALFQQKCAACHTLADANAKGTVGPNLDDAFGNPEQQGFAESTVRDVVRGQIAYASPPMPRDLVTGAQADAVASYVAQVAGKPVTGGGVKASALPGQSTSSTTGAAQTTTAPSGGGNQAAIADGKQVFASAGCAGCHTLKAAGATGTTGPNLDQLKPPQARVVKQVTNGGAIMPPFKGRLSPKQIQDVAAYVSSVAGT